MESTVEKRALLGVLAIAKSIADRKSAMPILAHVLLRAMDDDKLFVAATDLNISVSEFVASENTAEWSLTVHAANLHDIVARMPDGELSLRPSSQSLQLSSGNVDYELPAMNGRDFPRIHESAGLEFCDVDASVLREMIDRTLFSVSNDPARFHLNGVFFESDGANARMVATDGMRLVKVDRLLVGGPNLSAGIIVPTKGVQEIKKAIGGASNLSLAVKTPYLFVRGDAMTLAVKLIDSHFPPYEQVIPRRWDTELALDGDALLSALWRGLPLSCGARGVELRADGTDITLIADERDGSKLSEKVATNYSGLPWSVRFDARYLYEHVESMAPGDVIVRMIGPLDPVTMFPAADPAHIAVIMPMKPR